MSVNLVLDSAEWISNQSQDVSVSIEGISKTAPPLLTSWKKGHFNLSLWKQEELNPHEANEDAMKW